MPLQSLQSNNYYIITLTYPPQSSYDMLVQYKGYYVDTNTGKESMIFHHRVPDFLESLKILSSICINFIENEQDDCLWWETHVYADRFLTKKDLTPVVKAACNKFKQLVNKNPY